MPHQRFQHFDFYQIFYVVRECFHLQKISLKFCYEVYNPFPNKLLFNKNTCLQKVSFENAVGKVEIASKEKFFISPNYKCQTLPTKRVCRRQF